MEINTKIKSILLVVVLLLTMASANPNSGKKAGEPCTMSDNSPGICKDMLECNWYLQARLSKTFDVNEPKICSFFGPKGANICCPDPNVETTTKSSVESRYSGNENHPTKESPAQNACQFFKDNSGHRIFGGVDAALGEFPHMARLIYTNPKVRCGGTIISDQYVLTAAHCDGTPEYNLTNVLVGEILVGSGNDPKNIFEIETFTPHQNFSIDLHNDIAIIKLKNRLSFSQNIFPACLYTSMDDFAANIVLTVTGWGVTQDGNDASVLQKVNISQISLSSCQERYSSLYERTSVITFKAIFTGQICAGDDNHGPFPRRDSCKGDSGGPLQIQYTNQSADLVGIVSFGDSCGGSVPGVYTKIANYITWIEKHVNFNIPASPAIAVPRFDLTTEDPIDFKILT